MPKLPDAQDLGYREARTANVAGIGYRPTMVPDTYSRANIRAQDPQESPLTGVGKALGQIEETLYERQMKGEKFEAARAKSYVLQESLRIETEFDKDGDYGTYQKRYGEAMKKVAEKALSMVSNPEMKNYLALDIGDDLARGTARLADKALVKEKQAGASALEETLAKNEEAYLKAPDDATRAQILAASSSVINGGQYKGYIVDGRGRSREYAENLLTKRASLLSPMEAVKVLAPSETKDGMPVFKETGTWVDALPAEKRMKIYEAQREKVLNIDKTIAEDQILSVLKNENDALTASLKVPLAFSEIDRLSNEKKLGPAARSYFMKANGYTKADGTDNLDPDEKLEYKAQIYDELMTAAEKENLSASDLSALQEKVYSGMNNKSLTKAEGVSFLNQLMVPVIANKEKSLGDFSSGNYNPFLDNLGFSALKEKFDESYATPLPDDKEAGQLTQYRDNRNRVKLYDYYTSALEEEAQKRNIPWGQIPDLSSSERREVYRVAQEKAIKMYNSDNYPDLSSQKDTPNSVIPVYNKPSEIQEKYKLKDGKTITREDILDYARSKKTSPSAIVEGMRKKGLIE